MNNEKFYYSDFEVKERSITKRIISADELTFIKKELNTI